MLIMRLSRNASLELGKCERLSSESAVYCHFQPIRMIASGTEGERYSGDGGVARGAMGVASGWGTEAMTPRGIDESLCELPELRLSLPCADCEIEDGVTFFTYDL